MMVFRGSLPGDPHTRQPRTTTDRRLVSIRSRLSLVALAGLLALALGACGSDPAPEAPAAAGPGGPTVALKDLAYAPETLTVPAGTTVTWAWQDGAVAHDVKGDGFRSKVMATGTFAHRFAQPGTYPYACTLHPNMTGTIEVGG
jgi:plastocyanin